MIRQLNKSNLFFILGSLVTILVSWALGINIIIALVLVCLYAVLLSLRKPYEVRRYNWLGLLFLFLAIFFISKFIIDKDLPAYFIPFALIPMLATMLFSNLVLSLLITLAVAVSVGVIFADGLSLVIIFLISGLVSSLFVFKIRRRNGIIIAGLIVGIVQALCLFYLRPAVDKLQLAFFIINGVATGIITAGILPLFEYLFGVLTNISLLELSDSNHPLLRRLILEAPGTYHHSLLVGNLAEAAAENIGSDALLSRIGAYYHDIGKIEKSEYFSENQAPELSKHEALAPSMSKLVIMNHVKDGIELAKKYRLNPIIIDFISQHHGTSLAYYFYRKALEGLKEGEQVEEEGFRYPGPRPKTKEAAIVLLADSVEAASHALKTATALSIEEMVHKIINNKFIDGQLDECDLTLRDLEVISRVFIHILSGIYHGRVTYPEKESGHNYKKSSKEDSPQAQKDKRGGS